MIKITDMKSPGNIAEKIINYFVENDLPSDAVDAFGVWLTDEQGKEEKENALFKLWEQKEKEMTAQSKRTGGIFLRWKSLGWIAAILLALFCIPLSISIFADSDSTVKLISSNDGKGDFILPDGTKVWLNSGSTLEYSEDFADKEIREVKIEGEAFFEVTKDTRPFLVDMGSFSVKVLGTRFNVRNSDRFTIEEVTLESGAVEIDMGKKGSLMLKPGESFAYNPIKETWLVENVKTSNHTNWTNRIINFEGERLYDIIETLEHWYNIKITLLDNADSSMRLSFRLIPETVEETMTVISLLTGYEFRIIDNRNILIYKKN